MWLLAAILPTLVGYSAGAVIAGKGKRVMPELLDIAVVITMWGAALASRDLFSSSQGAWWPNWTAVGVWLIAGLAMGAGAAAVRLGRYPIKKVEPTPAGIRGLGRWWRGWRALGLRTGNYQSRLLLILFYFLILTPFGVLVRWHTDPLRLRTQQTGRAWVARENGATDLESARGQF